MESMATRNRAMINHVQLIGEMDFVVGARERDFGGGPAPLPPSGRLQIGLAIFASADESTPNSAKRERNLPPTDAPALIWVPANLPCHASHFRKIVKTRCENSSQGPASLAGKLMGRQ